MSDSGQTVQNRSIRKLSYTRVGRLVVADENILAIARAAVAEFGPKAGAEMKRRVEEHLRAGEEEGAELWRRVGAAIELLDAKRA